MKNLDRRDFLRQTAALGSAGLLGASTPQLASSVFAAPAEAKVPSCESTSRMKFGLVTYLWGKDMDLDTLFETCEFSGLEGVELRTEHRHGVEPSLSKQQRSEIKKRFNDSPIELVGYGSNAHFHENDPDVLKQNIELTKSYLQLMSDCGGSGVKVKPNGLVKGVPEEKTIEQIGKSLNELAKYGENLGQQIRVEVHGGKTKYLPVMKAIFEVADHPNATVCWNSNQADLSGKGLRHNFDLVKDRFGDTVHVRELNDKEYPYPKLLELFRNINYPGWILLEARTEPEDLPAAMKQQREFFDKLLAG